MMTRILSSLCVWDYDFINTYSEFKIKGAKIDDFTG